MIIIVQDIMYLDGAAWSKHVLLLYSSTVHVQYDRSYAVWQFKCSMAVHIQYNSSYAVRQFMCIMTVHV